MSQIVNNQSLEVGLVTSSEVVNPSNVRFHIKTSNIVAEYKKVTVKFFVKDGSANYATLVDDNNLPIELVVIGNLERSRNIFGINSASLVVKVENEVGLVGNIDIWTNEN